MPKFTKYNIGACRLGSAASCYAIRYPKDEVEAYWVAKTQKRMRKLLSAKTAKDSKAKITLPKAPWEEREE